MENKIWIVTYRDDHHYMAGERAYFSDETKARDCFEKRWKELEQWANENLKNKYFFHGHYQFSCYLDKDFKELAFEVRRREIDLDTGKFLDYAEY